MASFYRMHESAIMLTVGIQRQFGDRFKTQFELYDFLTNIVAKAEAIAVYHTEDRNYTVNGLDVEISYCPADGDCDGITPERVFVTVQCSSLAHREYITVDDPWTCGFLEIA